MQYIRVMRMSDKKEVERHPVDEEKFHRLHYIKRDIVTRLKRDHPGERYAVDLVGDSPHESANDPLNRGREGKIQPPAGLTEEELRKWRRRYY